MRGYTRQELESLTWAELTFPGDISGDVENFNRVLAREIDGYSLDKRFICKNGQFIWVTLAVRCVRPSDGEVDYFVALLQDITASRTISGP